MSAAGHYTIPYNLRDILGAGGLILLVGYVAMAMFGRVSDGRTLYVSSIDLSDRLAKRKKTHLPFSADRTGLSNPP